MLYLADLIYLMSVVVGAMKSCWSLNFDVFIVMLQNLKKCLLFKLYTVLQLSEIQKHIRIKIHNTVASLTLLGQYGSEKLVS
jgi:hypothetical protein